MKTTQTHIKNIELYDEDTAIDGRHGHADVVITEHDENGLVVGMVTTRLYIKAPAATVSEIRETAIPAAQHYRRNAQLPSQSGNSPERLAQLWLL